MQEDELAVCLGGGDALLERGLGRDGLRLVRLQELVNLVGVVAEREGRLAVGALPLERAGVLVGDGLPARVEDGQVRKAAVADVGAIALGEVVVLAVLAGVDEHGLVLVEQLFAELRLREAVVEGVAPRAPVAPPLDEHAPVIMAGALEGGGDLLLCIDRLVVEGLARGLLFVARRLALRGVARGGRRGRRWRRQHQVRFGGRGGRGSARWGGRLRRRRRACREPHADAHSSHERCDDAHPGHALLLLRSS